MYIYIYALDTSEGVAGLQLKPRRLPFGPPPPDCSWLRASAKLLPLLAVVLLGADRCTCVCVCSCCGFPHCRSCSSHLEAVFTELPSQKAQDENGDKDGE